MKKHNAPTPPILDGTADTTDAFDCGVCGGKHLRLLSNDEDDGVAGGQGRHASQLRDGYVIFCGVLVGLSVMVSFVLWLALR